MSREFRHPLLQFSLLLNAVLAVTVVLVRHNPPEPAPAPPVRAASPAIVTNATRVSGSQVKPLQFTDIASPSDRRRWLVDQLRAAGVPNNVLARVVRSDLEEDWQKRFEESHGDADAMAAIQQEHDAKQEADMRAALGEEGFRQWDQANLLREVNLGKLPFTTAEANTLYDLKKKLRQRIRELEQARLKGQLDDTEINDEQAKAYAEFNQQMKALLGEERYAKSQGMDEGTAATNLRQDLAKVNPSDAQFQDLLKAQQQWNQRRAELDKQFQDDPSAADYTEQIKALDESRDQEYQRVLGTNVFDTLQKQQDASYSKMKKYEDVWGLDDDKIDHVYRAIKYYEKSAREYLAQVRALEAQGQSVDWNAVNKNQQQFAEQTQQVLQSYLGQNCFDKIQRNGVFQFNPAAQRGPSQ